jgi:hypothetical protein
MSGNLIIPRVEVKWGDLNLTSYNGIGKLDYPTNEPLVFQVECTLSAQSNGPSGTMMWSPAGSAYKVYEYCITNLMDKIISIRFYYDNGKSIVLNWVWCGQSISFGNDMSIKVNLASKLSGTANGTIRSVNISNTDKPASKESGLKKLPEKYGVDAKTVTLSKCAQRDMKKATFNNYAQNNSSFGSSVVKFAGENGNVVFAHNIETDGMVVMCPFTWDKTQTIIDARLIPKNASPNPGERYGYILGPSIINSLTRETQWKPPQQSRTANPAKTSQPINKPNKNNKKTNKTQANPALSTIVQETDKKPTSSPVGSSKAVSLTMNNANDPDVAKKKEALENEATAKLSCQTLMVPILVGIKPHDIIYIPSFNGEYIEDWIVGDVHYQQTDGGVTVGISATRTYGTGDLMNSAEGKKFQQIIKNELRTLENWESYAWYSEYNNSSATAIAPTATATIPAATLTSNASLVPAYSDIA